ncbi:hypothetical protein PSHT_06740 [Puccinia striiformis]|uniref:Mnd1 HTH domain-containing protein n=1 Tax=Puccinia striiformis TaxID=27350 RepID=A0A2S4W3T7_9BASI|nr:hypothetical protein PSHT_06740 [Puccinia striiformis]
MSKRGLNPEEKRTKTLEFFHENLVPKAKGVVAQSVEETVKSLVDDGMWARLICSGVSLPSRVSLLLGTGYSLDAEKERLEKERIDLQSQLEKSAADRSANEERENNLREIKVLRQDISDIKDKLKLHSINDPHVVEEKMRLCELYKSGAEIWTENLSIMMSHCRNQYQIDRYKFCGQFELEEDFEEALEKIEST